MTRTPHVYIPFYKVIDSLKHYPVRDDRTLTKKEAQDTAKKLRPRFRARVVKMEDGRYMVYKRIRRKGVKEVEK